MTRTLVRARPAARVGMIRLTSEAIAGTFLDSDGWWVPLTLDAVRTIGSPASGANVAQAWADVLFAHIWNQYDNTRSPLLDSAGSPASRGGTAAEDWAANRRITLPDYRGRVFAGAGTGSGLSARTKGAVTGVETVTQQVSTMPEHDHLSPTGSASIIMTRPGTGGTFTVSQTAGSTHATTGYTVRGGGNSHTVIQPSAIEHYLIAAGVR